MAKLKQCKTCNKCVADRVRKCPHCGQVNPTITSKDALEGCLGIIVISIVAAVILSMCSDDADMGNVQFLQDLEQVGTVSPEQWLALDKRVRINTAMYYYYHNRPSDEWNGLLANNYSKLMDKAVDLEACVTDKVETYVGQEYVTSTTGFLACIDS